MGWKTVAIGGMMAILALFSWNIYHFFRLEKHLSGRALVIVADNSDQVSPEAEQFYEKYKTGLLPIEAILFRTSPGNFKGLSAVEVIDKYGEPALGKGLLGDGQGYKQEVLLTGKTANLDSLAQNLARLSNENLTVDIIVVSPGNDAAYLWNGQVVSLADIRTKLYPLHPNLGVVYLAAGWGSQQMEVWRELGARVVNEPMQTEGYPPLAPGGFLTAWTNGESFEKAVSSGYNHEIGWWKFAGAFFPETAKWAQSEASAAAQINFSGDKTLSALNN